MEAVVTTPAPPQAPPQTQPPPPQQDTALDDTALAVALAALLAGGTAVAAAGGVAAVIAALKLRFALSAAAWSALGSVLSMVTEKPHPVAGAGGQASAQASRLNAARRAQYVLAATRRVLVAARETRAKGGSVPGAIAGALATERQYYQLHLAAMANRAEAAAVTDAAAAKYGDLLGWLAKNDARTSAECRAASGKNYYASHMPDIGLPGAVHPHCRCRPVAPWPGGKLLPSSGARFARTA
jgi:hypothetical protein